MWAIIQNNNISEIIKGAKGVEINGVQHSRDIFSLWSTEELSAVGIIPYVIQNNGNSDFSYKTGSSVSISDDGTQVIETIEYTDKLLEDELQVNSDGDAIMDSTTGKQAVIKGLKTLHKENTATKANTLLSPTDWQVVKAMETSSSVPSDISTYRSAVRSKANEIETTINACDTMDKFKALFVTPTDSDGNASGDAPIYDWPD
tara:strand:- start:1118 stop:1726 length:609 start_codon:yes stop_codon:yes gene_type:complete